MPSDILRLDGPMIGYARLVSLSYSPNQSQGMDIISVISLGHRAKQPLMRASSELVDGSEPHGCIQGTAVGVYPCRRGAGRGGVYPGWV